MNTYNNYAGTLLKSGGGRNLGIIIQTANNYMLIFFLWLRTCRYSYSTLTSNSAPWGSCSNTISFDGVSGGDEGLVGVAIPLVGVVIALERCSVWFSLSSCSLVSSLLLRACLYSFTILSSLGGGTSHDNQNWNVCSMKALRVLMPRWRHWSYTTCLAYLLCYKR